MEHKFILNRCHVYDFKAHLKLALIADLHQQPNRQLLKMLEAERPDLILIAGDTLERHDRGKDPREKEETHLHKRFYCGLMLILRKLLYALSRKANAPDDERIYAFLKALSGIAPVYMSRGNHEWYLKKQDHALFKKCGIVFLDNEDVTVQVKGETVLIGGLSPAYDLKWLSVFAAKPGYKILLCHHPEYYEKLIKGSDRDRFDLILSGHCHGGQWRIGGRGLIAPGQGLFPGYCRGIYATEGGTMIVSAGCSNTTVIPRFGNPCELVVIEK